MRVFLNGKFVDEKKAVVPATDHGFLYGDGIYETLRTYGGKIWQMDKHLKRLERSARLMKIPLPWDRAKIGSWVEKLIEKNGFGESRIRITVTRGVNGTVFTGGRKPTILIQAARLKPEKTEVYKKGVEVITVRMKRILPRAKTTSLLPMVLAWQRLEKEHAYEAIYIDEKGFVKEGTVTNVFIVKNGKVFSPKSGVLAGTTRDAVTLAARRAGTRVRLADFTVRRLYKADEVFITNAPRGVVPVRMVDGRKIGKKCPGPVTRQIMTAFEKYVWKNI